jgi:hypothetical protein
MRSCEIKVVESEKYDVCLTHLVKTHLVFLCERNPVLTEWGHRNLETAEMCGF